MFCFSQFFLGRGRPSYIFFGQVELYLAMALCFSQGCLGFSWLLPSFTSLFTVYLVCHCFCLVFQGLLSFIQLFNVLQFFAQLFIALAQFFVAVAQFYLVVHCVCLVVHCFCLATPSLCLRFSQFLPSFSQPAVALGVSRSPIQGIGRAARSKGGAKKKKKHSEHKSYIFSYVLGLYRFVVFCMSFHLLCFAFFCIVVLLVVVFYVFDSFVCLVLQLSSALNPANRKQLRNKDNT